MALWSVRLGAETRSGLTVYQLQELIRTGQVPADAHVSDGTDWKMVLDVPALARSLPVNLEATRAHGVRTVNVLGIELEVDENGKPKPPPPEVVAQLLASQSTQTVDPERMKRFNRGMLVTISIFIMVLMLLILRQMVLTGQFQD